MSKAIEANKELARREITELWDEHNFAFIEEAYADTVGVGMVRTGAEERIVERDALRALYEEWYEAFPDLSVDINHEVAEDDTVVCHVTLRGTHDGAFRGIEPTGNEIEIDGFHLRRIQDGKIVEATSMAGMGTLFQQLGVELPIRV